MVDNTTVVKFRQLYMFVQKGKQPMLDIRRGLVYGKLAPLRKPVSASKLCDMLGGLVSLPTVHKNLAKLETLGMVTHTERGWLAQEPPAELQPHFCRLKKAAKDADDDRWHGRYATWRITLPAENPFPGMRNGTELYAVYWLIAHMERTRSHHPWSAAELARILRIKYDTLRGLLVILRDKGLLTDDKKLAPHDFKLERVEVEVKGPDQRDALEVVVGRLKKREEILSAANSLEMTRADALKLIRDALTEHKKHGERGDGSDLILDWLGKRIAGREAKAKAADAYDALARQRTDAAYDRQVLDALKSKAAVHDGELSAMKRLYGFAALEGADTALGYCPHRLSSDDLIEVLKADEVAKKEVAKKVKSAAALRNKKPDNTVKVFVPATAAPIFNHNDEDNEDDTIPEDELEALLTASM